MSNAMKYRSNRIKTNECKVKFDDGKEWQSCSWGNRDDDGDCRVVQTTCGVLILVCCVECMAA